ncbi:MAG TPA: hypothetical protein VER11_32805 [Polyangiaceae bacterium]|nr:hypothetical protein [Polyangiaceae bacterium]
MNDRMRLGTLASIAAAASISFAGCSGSETKPTSATTEGAANSVGLALEPVAGVTLNTLHFVVSKTTAIEPVLEGDLPTPGTASTFNVGLPIPVGGDYRLSLSGVAAESASIICSGAVAPFLVTPNQITKLSATLACRDLDKGTVDNRVTVNTDACPRLSLDYLIATPSSVNLGSPIVTFSKATDLDGRPVTYAWKTTTPAAGSFASATSANAIFTCSAAGADVPLTVTASNGQCDKSLTTSVSCVDPLCGNGQRDPGEKCDSSAGDFGCTPDCEFVPVCGDGKVSPREICDPKLTVDNCGRDCRAITSDACITCDLTTECRDFVDCFQVAGNAAAGTPAAGTPKAQLCNETLDCVRDSGCGGGDNRIIKCYCGTATAVECQNGLGNGVCKAELQRALETTEFAQILQRFKSPQYGGGLAMARVDCEWQVCKTACGL